MADTNTALAQASDSDVLSADDLQAFLNTAPEAVAQTPVVATPKTQVEPVKLTIHGVELTPAEIEAKLEATKAEAIASMQDRLGIADAFLALPESQRQVLVETAEKLRQGINPLEAGTRELVVRPIDVPAEAVIPYVAWAELSDEAKQGHAVMSGMYNDLEAKLKQLSGIVAGMQQFVGAIHNKTQDQTTAEAMALKGFTGCTAADVAAWKAKGIADPIKAAEAGILTPPKQEAKKTEEAPPEASSGGSQKFYDSKTTGMTMDQHKRMLDAGYLPADPKERAKLLELRAKAS